VSERAAVALRRQGGLDLLVAYAEAVQALPIGPEAKRIRRNAAARLLDANPDLAAWMAKPTPARVADLRRTGAWLFVAWCFVEGHLRPDLDLLLAKTPGDLYVQWADRHPEDVAAITAIAHRFSWSVNWTNDLTRGGLALICMFAGKSLRQLDDADFDRFAAELAAAPSAGWDARSHNQARLFSLRQACYELRICDIPPRKNRRPAATTVEYLQAVPQPAIRSVARRYVEVIATTMQPSTVWNRAASLILFGEYLTAHHPEILRLKQLQRTHIEAFLIWNHGRPWRGRVARDKPVSAVASKQAVVDLKTFLDDLAIWGWAERPKTRLVFPSDIPRLDRPLPRALAPDSDRDLMAAVAELADPFARTGLTILRGSGLRLGELLDLELDCLWDFGNHGTWVRVPLGKLATERSVPLDDDTLAAFDTWMARRGPQRALPHPRYGRPADFLFVERGRRLSAYRLRKGLDDAAAAARLTGKDGAPLHPTPHALRHTYGTSLVNAGMSLQALMALMGHVSAEMTLRYASLASPTVRAAYEAAIGKIKTNKLFVVPAGKTVLPDRLEWLRSEMIKTRVAHGYCSRDLVAEACPYSNICEQCENFVTTPEFRPALQAQLADIVQLRDDAEARGWQSEVARHQRVIASIESHLRRLKNSG
jgi:site-specific recombinase XerD